MGRPDPPELVLIFRGTHQVLSAEKNLKKAGIRVRLIPVPRKLSSDCGLAIRIPSPDRERARAALSRAGVLPASVHILLEEGHYGQEPL